jgi:sugar lactone lactonase YvrE
MTIDANGKLWVAIHGASSVVQIDPETQTELMTVEVPVLCPTSVVFGGTRIPHFPTYFPCLQIM